MYCPDRQDDFIDILNQGASVISLLGTSGGPESFGGWFWAYDNRDAMPHPEISFNDLENINTGMPFLIAPNCHQGEINNPDYGSTMRKLMVYDNGGIIGAIAHTHGSEQHANGYVLYRFHDLIFQDEAIPYGQLFRTIKEELFNDPNYSWLEFNNNALTYFGDPSLVPSIYKHRSGSIASSTTWSGNFVVEGLTVQEGVNLTTLPGTKLFFPSYAQFWVNGTLTANGTEHNKILFDFISQDSFDQNGIRIAEGGTINLSHAIVKNAYNGIYIDIDGWSSTIQNSTIQNCHNGIIANIASQNADILIEYNLIEDNTNYGIKMSNPGFGLHNIPLLSNNTIKNSSHGIHLTGMGDLSIENSLIDYCTHGIYLYNSFPVIENNTILEPYGNGIYGEANGGSPLIKGNTIKKITRNLYNYQGIYLQNSTNPFITENDIQGFLHGIYYGGGGSGHFTDYVYNTPPINNRLVDNKHGLTVAWGSYLIAGTDYRAPAYVGHNNSIWGNSIADAYAYQSGTIIAKQNWWGEEGGNFITATNGYIDSSNPLDYDPWDGIPLRQNNDNVYPNTPIEEDPISLDDILAGIELEVNGNIPGAIKHYKKMIKDISHPKFAIGRLAGIKYRFVLVQRKMEFRVN
jgi:parallel beta-helix repeat protein